jgi:hypothetical protein
MKDVPPMSLKQAQFFAGLIVICTITAGLILIIDFQIKGAILEQVERYYRGQNPAPTGGNRPGNHPGNDLPYPSDLVGGGNAGVEKTSAVYAGNYTSKPSGTVRAESNGTHGNSRVPDSDIESES